MSMYLAGMKREIGVEKACLSTIRLTYEAHDPFFVLFNAAVEESNVIFASVPFPAG